MTTSSCIMFSQVTRVHDLITHQRAMFIPLTGDRISALLRSGIPGITSAMLECGTARDRIVYLEDATTSMAVASFKGFRSVSEVFQGSICLSFPQTIFAYGGQACRSMGQLRPGPNALGTSKCSEFRYTYFFGISILHMVISCDQTSNCPCGLSISCVWMLILFNGFARFRILPRRSCDQHSIPTLHVSSQSEHRPHLVNAPGDDEAINAQFGDSSHKTFGLSKTIRIA